METTRTRSIRRLEVSNSCAATIDFEGCLLCRFGDHYVESSDMYMPRINRHYESGEPDVSLPFVYILKSVHFARETERGGVVGTLALSSSIQSDSQ